MRPNPTYIGVEGHGRAARGVRRGAGRALTLTLTLTPTLTLTLTLTLGAQLEQLALLAHGGELLTHLLRVRVIGLG